MMEHRHERAKNMNDFVELLKICWKHPTLRFYFWDTFGIIKVILVKLHNYIHHIYNFTYMGSLYCCCLVAKLCSALCDSVDCSPPGPLVRGILSPGKNTGVVAMPSFGIFLTQRLNPLSCTGRWVRYHWATWEARFLTGHLPNHIPTWKEFV